MSSHVITYQFLLTQRLSHLTFFNIYFKTGETGLQGSTVVAKGLHNWYQFYLEQNAGRLVYTPPPKNTVDNSKKVTPN